MGKHKKFVHLKQKPKFTCHFCGKEYIHTSQFKIHVEKHLNKTKDVECDVCNKMFHSEIEMKMHKRKLHVPKKFLCTQCDYTARFESILQKHMLLHTTEKPFSCDRCTLKFKDARNLKVHVQKVHENARNYICTYCNKAFGSSTNLKTHVRLHTGEMEAHCDICNKGFAQKYNYKMHMAKSHGIDT